MNPGMRTVGGLAPGGWSGFDRHLDRAMYRPPQFPPTAAVEPVAAEEVVEVLIDMFRG